MGEGIFTCDKWVILKCHLLHYILNTGMSDGQKSQYFQGFHRILNNLFVVNVADVAIKIGNIKIHVYRDLPFLLATSATKRFLKDECGKKASNFKGSKHLVAVAGRDYFLRHTCYKV